MIKNIKNEELLNEIAILSSEETIYIDLDKDISNIIQLIEFKIKSYENLFLSYINNTTEEACNLNLQAFIDCYSELYIEENRLIREELIKNIGFDTYKYLIEAKINYNFNLRLNKIEISK